MPAVPDPIGGFIIIPRALQPPWEPGTSTLHCGSERLVQLSKVIQPELAELGCKPGVPGSKTQGMLLLQLIMMMTVGLVLGQLKSRRSAQGHLLSAWDEVMSSAALLRFRLGMSLSMLLFCFPFCIFTNVSAGFFCPEALQSPRALFQTCRA